MHTKYAINIWPNKRTYGHNFTNRKRELNLKSLCQRSTWPFFNCSGMTISREVQVAFTEDKFILPGNQCLGVKITQNSFPGSHNFRQNKKVFGSTILSINIGQ